MCEALRELMKEEIEEELKKNREQAIQQGLEQGLEQGRINQLIDLVKQNLLSIETAAQCAKMTVDEFQIVLKRQNSEQYPTRTGMRHYSAAFLSRWLTN